MKYLDNIFIKTQHDKLFCVINIAGDFVEINLHWTEQFGWNIEELIGSPVINFIHPNDIELTLKTSNDLASKESIQYENRFRCKNGKYIWLSWHSVLDQESRLVFSVLEDITVSKRNDLIQKYIQNNLKIGHWELDLETNDIFWSEMTHNILETDPKNYYPNLATAFNFYYPEDIPALKDVVEKLVNKGVPYNLEAKLITAKGKRIWIRATGDANIIDGKIQRVYGTFQDVTVVQNIKEQIAQVLKNCPVMIYQFKLAPDGKTYFPTVSDYCYQIFGITPEELKAAPSILEDYIHPDDKEKFKKNMQDSSVNLGAANDEWRIISKSGTVKWIKFHSVAEKEEDGTIRWDGGLIDITEEVDLRKKIEFERIKSLQSAKLASLGEMSAAIAHEINNPLSIISTASATLKKSINDLIKFDARIDTINRSVNRIVKIINGIKKFTRTNSTKIRSLHLLSEIINESMGLVEIILKFSEIESILEINTNSSILCDDAEIEQVIVNLINNAVEAVKNLTPKWVKIVAFDEGAVVILRVIDSGKGIEKNILDKIFEPFFTTKPIGLGTGLGLSISKGIIEDHHGSIIVTTIDGNTCFEIRLPAAMSTR